VELIAAIVGTMVGVAGMGIGSVIKRENDGREAIVKLSMGVEQIGKELQAMREDMKEDRHEIYGRLGSIEQRISKLEARR
jgi:hypothetical protein|tara:strand:- start:1062 stop:1301 length:240 start_codon:yes stop_codon:yes gene_type:complete